MDSNIVAGINNLLIKSKNSKNKDNYTVIIRDPKVMDIDTIQYFLMGAGQCEYVSEVLSYREVVYDSMEYNMIREVFLKEQLLVLSVKGVVNPYVKQSFELKRSFHYQNVIPLIMYHGTKEKYVDSICTFNFNWRYTGFENGYKCGKGVNFSDKPVYSSKFCDKNTLGGVIIIADVLIKSILPGSPNIVVPPPGCDTTVD